ncbi:MAG: DUF6268 family outer membrane beta-barrel protein [Prevotella sp.]|jgi:hypothetical protein
MNKKIILLAITFIQCVTMNAQRLEISGSFITKSTFKDNSNNEMGEGSMQKYTLKFNTPLSVKTDSLGRRKSWNISLHGAYGVLDNSGDAENLNPEDILNVSTNISYSAPVGKHWTIIASAGVGIYAETDNIRWESMMGNAAAMFVHSSNERLIYGIGGGLTTKYGVPIIGPVMFLNWRLNDATELILDYVSRNKISVSHQFSNRLRTELALIDTEAMSAIIKVEGKSKIYSVTEMLSYLRPSYKLSKNCTLTLKAGVDWRRYSRISNRKICDFFKNFTNKDHRYNFSPALTIGASLRYTF